MTKENFIYSYTVEDAVEDGVYNPITIWEKDTRFPYETFVSAGITELLNKDKNNASGVIHDIFFLISVSKKPIAENLYEITVKIRGKNYRIRITAQHWNIESDKIVFTLFFPEED